MQKTLSKREGFGFKEAYKKRKGEPLTEVIGSP
jgi:hypothetical protein